MKITDNQFTWIICWIQFFGLICGYFLVGFVRNIWNPFDYDLDLLVAAVETGVVVWIIICTILAECGSSGDDTEF